MKRVVGRRCVGLAVVAISLHALVPSAPAQTNDQLYANLQLGFYVPGGRAFSMGNAFIGEANDASAAYTNPAGLLALTSPEASFEMRFQDADTTVADGSSFSGSPTNRGVDMGSPPTTFSATTTGLSYVAVVYPMDRWVIAGYRHEFANFRSTVDGSQGAFLRDGGARTRTEALQSNLELDIVNTGFSAGYRLSDILWLGGGVSVYQLDLEGVSARHKTVDVDPRGVATTFFESVGIDPVNQTDRRVESATGTDIGFNAGFLARFADGRISYGAVYRRGPKFDYISQFRLGPRWIAEGVDPSLESVLSGEATFHAPDFFGVGVSLHPTPAWTLNVDYARVLYSNLQPDANFGLAVATGMASLSDFRVQDGNEIHFGAEYVWTAAPTASVAFRGGAWFDPDHQLTFVGPFDALQARFPAGEDQWHVTGGIGIVVASFDLSFGFDTSDIANRASFASTIRF